MLAVLDAPNTKDKEERGFVHSFKIQCVCVLCSPVPTVPGLVPCAFLFFFNVQ